MDDAQALADEETSVGLRYIMRQGIAGHAMGTLAGGVFMVEIALSLGASLFLIGLLAALPSLAQLAQLPATYLVERYRDRKRIAFLGLGGVRVCIFAIAMIPLAVPTLVSPGGGLGLLLGFVALQGVFSATGGTAWNSWIRDVVPTERMGAFFSRRQQLTLLLGVPLSLAAAAFVAVWAERFPALRLEGFSVLFLCGVAAGLVGLYFLSRVPSVGMPPVDGHTDFADVIGEPFRDPTYRQLIAFLGSWNFGVALAAPFFTVYLLQRLGYGLPVVIALGVVSQLVNAAFAPVWGRLSDRFSNKAVLGVSGPLVLVATGLWLFTGTPDPHSFTLPLLVAIHVLRGMSMSGVTLATGNIGMKLAPRGRGTAYLAANGLVGAVAAGVAPLLGGAIANAAADYRLTTTIDLQRPGQDLAIQTLSVQGIDFAFVLSLAIGVYAMHRLTSVVEEGRQQRSEVVQSLLLEVKRPLLSFTTVGGFTELVTFPFGVVGRERRRNRRPRSERRRPGDDRETADDRKTREGREGGDGRERRDEDDRPPEDGGGP